MTIPTAAIARTIKIATLARTVRANIDSSLVRVVVQSEPEDERPQDFPAHPDGDGKSVKQRRNHAGTWLARIPAEEIDEFGELLARRLAVTGFDGVGDAAVGMVFQDRIFDALQSRLDGLNLIKNIDAVAILFQHAGDSAHLPFDARQPGDELWIGFHTIYPLWVYCNAGRQWMPAITVSYCCLLARAPSRAHWDGRSSLDVFSQMAARDPRLTTSISRFVITAPMACVPGAVRAADPAVGGSPVHRSACRFPAAQSRRRREPNRQQDRDRLWSVPFVLPEPGIFDMAHSPVVTMQNCFGHGTER